MVIELKDITPETLADALSCIKASRNNKIKGYNLFKFSRTPKMLCRFRIVRKQKTLAKHFGALKRGLDGLEYQRELRNQWPD
jgi:hypothetical protein